MQAITEKFTDLFFLSQFLLTLLLAVIYEYYELNVALR